MESNKITKEQLKNAFCEVRKAHRLVYEYQRRMQDLSWFIKNKLGFPDYKGYKRFSAPLSPRNTIHVDNWSWDWIYSYMYEYNLGTVKSGDLNVSVCLLQISDSGYFKTTLKTKAQTKIETFTEVENSDSLLTFYVVIQKGASEKHWEPDLETACDLERKVNSTDDFVEILYPVPLYCFFDEDATIQILRDFVVFCNEKSGTTLTVQE